MSNECSEHPGEQKKLFCIDPCKVSLCQDCYKVHKGHDIKSLNKVIEELEKYLNDKNKERKKEYQVLGKQIKMLDHLKSDTETFLKYQIEEEKRMEKLVLEPLRDIINNFQDKVNSFLNSLATKKQSCELLEDQVYNQTKALETAFNSISTLTKKEDWNAIYELWLTHLHKSSETEGTSEKEALHDVDSLKDYAEDLKNLNILGKMKIVVQSFTSALQMENDDQVSRFADRLALSNEDMKALQETLVHAQGSIKGVSNSIEAMRKEIKASTTTVINILKKAEINMVDKVEETVEKSEKTLKEAREKLIEEIQKANSFYSELITKQKDLSDIQLININTISDWKKGIINCEKEHVVFKKLLSQIKEQLEGYGKEIIRYNLQYGQKMEELDELDDKLQSIRADIRNHQDQAQFIAKRTKYKLRISVISVADVSAQVLINKFIYNSMEEGIKEPLVTKESIEEKKGYTVIANSDVYEAEFCLWNLGALKDPKITDSSYISNVEAILLLYDVNDKASLENTKATIQLINGKTSAIVVLIGITKESNAEIDEAIKDYALSKLIALKVINISNGDEVKELFYGVLYARYPDLYESINN